MQKNWLCKLTVFNYTSLSVLVALVIVLLALLFSGMEINHLLRYQKAELLAGEWWRLFTGHFVHLSAPHGLMNIVGLIAIALVVGHLLRFSQWIITFAFLLPFISLSLLFFSPQVTWYVGFSGVLHGMLVLGLIVGSFAGHRRYMFALVAVMGKIIWEQTPFFDVNHLSGVISGAVVVDAHLYGSLGGLLVALFFTRKTAKKPMQAE